MEPVLMDLRLHRRQLATWWRNGSASSPLRDCPQRRHRVGLQAVTEATRSSGTKALIPRGCPFCPPRRLFDGGAGGCRFTPIGSDDGGLELLVEFWSRRAFSSRTCCLTSATCRSKPSMMAPMTARASSERLSQMCWGIEAGWSMWPL
ncbi:MAG: hypothetical protein IRY99_26580 [Isosphaeraceae bacterium]|nr:hypothetical protein [Isosphaeraceae bacterium]